MSEPAINPRAVIGGNLPPLTPFEVVEKKITDLFDEAILYLDGELVSSQGVADDIGNLLRLIRDAEAEADDLRKQENEPFDLGKAAVQARYAPLIANTKTVKGKTVQAADACKKALAPWLEKKDAEQREAARIARAEADAKAEAARRAHQEAAQATNLAQQVVAEQMVADAARAEKAAAKAENQTAKAGGAFGKSTSLRTTPSAEVVDAISFARWVWFEQKEELEIFLSDLARRLCATGIQNMPGVVITEIKTVV